ncbi:DUF2809 domain-containing protein [Metabacillus litoralis]|uniref:ribosomal maturation YjgA family protein n=1 Tax=Metabacillus litoralis TaxID=152268 RepID=UPI001CFD429A|nr:DUF2809 domain-containing protein [Metabacillus litoralis]
MYKKGTILYKRTNYIFAIFITIILGLASREFSYIFPSIITQNAGDILWAMMSYYGFRFLLIRKNLHISFWFSLIFCFIIEFSQLYQADWINFLRSNLIGALILGKGYLTIDLIRYTTGIIIATVLDKLTYNR